MLIPRAAAYRRVDLDLAWLYERCGRTRELAGALRGATPLRAAGHLRLRWAALDADPPAGAAGT
ncbi:MAG: hypothetical protein JXQ29_08730 [Planctomycetes bacterium]|nr:hypothetical protein [Planctomycetota bacterium]